MNDSSTANNPGTSQASGRSGWRYFFVIAGILFPLVTLFGFFPSWLDMNAGNLDVHWFTHVHAGIMSAWLVVFVVQTVVAACGNLSLHRRIGSMSIWLGWIVIAVMALVTMRFLIANHPPEGSFLFDLLLTAIYEITCFAIFFILGILSRRGDLGIHKRALTLATFVLLTAAVDRMCRRFGFPTFGLEYAWFWYLDLLLIPLIIYDIIKLGRIHRMTLMGCLIVIASQVIVLSVKGSPWWHKLTYQVTLPLMHDVEEVRLSESQEKLFVGDYDSEFGLITISRSDGKLYLQFNHQDKQELGARSESELFMKEEVMNLKFELDDNDAVRRATLIIVGHKHAMVKRKE